MYEAIVVGARCAGAALAMLLVRRGHRVALIDRLSFPSDTLSSHFLWTRGAAWLQAWACSTDCVRAGASRSARFRWTSGRWFSMAPGPSVDGVSDMYAPRRTILDKLLVDAAVEAGAELFEEVSIDEMACTPSRLQLHRR